MFQVLLEQIKGRPFGRLLAEVPLFDMTLLELVQVPVDAEAEFVSLDGDVR